MSNYGGRRGPNVTQYLNSLQTDAPADETFMEDDLALFTNTQFFDFDAGRTTDYQAPSVKAEAEEAPSADDVGSSTSPITDLPGSLDFMQDFNFTSPEFPYQTPSLAPYSDGLPLHSLQPSASVPYVTPTQQQQAPFVQSSTARTGDKRKASGSLAGGDGALSLEEQSRIAAEEDKRRRNTAASARFRIKKKQREQALEKSAKEMSEKVTVLEGKIQQLETENRWLKSMILEKNGGNEQIAALLEKGLNAKEDSEEHKGAAKDIELSRKE